MGDGEAVKRWGNGGSAVCVRRPRGPGQSRGPGRAGAARCLLLAAAVALCVAACDRASTSAAAAVQPAARADLVWHTLGTWSGRGPAQTGSFDVGTGALRVTWKTERTGGAAVGRFRIVLHSAISGRPLQTVVDVTGQGADTTYIQDEPRVSYFEVEADGLAWQIAVAEASAATTPARP